MTQASEVRVKGNGEIELVGDFRGDPELPPIVTAVARPDTHGAAPRPMWLDAGGGR